MSWYKQIATNTLFQIIARIATSGSSFIITIIVARHLGIAGYGDFAKVTAFVSLFYLLADFGLNAIFLQKENTTRRFADLLYGRLFLAVILVVVVTLLALVLPYNAGTAIGFSPFVKLGIALFSLTLITEAITYSATAIFQRELTYKYASVSAIVGSLVTLIFVSISVLFSYSLFLIILSFILGGIVKSALALLLTREHMLPIRVDTAFAKQLVRESFPLTVMLLCNLIYFRIDMLLLASLKPSHDVAIYDLAYKFFDFLIALPLFLSNALYPSLLKQENVKLNFRFPVLKYSGMFVLFSLIVLIPTWFLAPFVSIIRPEFADAILPLRILLLSLPVFFVTSILQWLLITKKQQVFLASVYFCVTIVNVLLNTLFIPHASYIASAIITGISEAVIMLALYLRLLRKY